MNISFNRGEQERSRLVGLGMPSLRHSKNGKA
jgi:hypothetical protein